MPTTTANIPTTTTPIGVAHARIWPTLYPRQKRYNRKARKDRYITVPVPWLEDGVKR